MFRDKIGVWRWVFPTFHPEVGSSSAPFAWLWRAGSRLLALLIPENCRVCGVDLGAITRIPVCAQCLREIEPIEAEYACAQCRTQFLNGRPLNEDGLCRLCAAGVTNFDTALACGYYDGALRELILLYKYHKVRPLARHFGALLARSYPRGQAFDAIVPVPMHWLKYLTRGFDHTQALARELSRRTGVPVVRAIRKVKRTPAQAELTRARRRENVRRAFAARGGAKLEGLNVLLLDDVFTTGATANAAAAALRKAGAAHVSILTVARADRYGSYSADRPARAVKTSQGASE